MRQTDDFFFFSSRRRHTIYWRDWSSDVCSSDLFAIWLLVSYFEDIPFEMEEAAYLDGASRWKTLWRIIIPQVRGGIAVTVVFVFLNAWNEFRSEEHTSELQSRQYLVCRLLLEKKSNTNIDEATATRHQYNPPHRIIQELFDYQHICRQSLKSLSLPH